MVHMVWDKRVANVKQAESVLELVQIRSMVCTKVLLSRFVASKIAALVDESRA
jgi:hypothetical protein